MALNGISGNNDVNRSEQLGMNIGDTNKRVGEAFKKFSAGIYFRLLV